MTRGPDFENQVQRQFLNTYSNQKWTKDEVDWLLENRTLGIYAAMDHLGRGYSNIVNQACRLRISLKRNGVGSGRNLDPNIYTGPKWLEPRKSSLPWNHPVIQGILRLHGTRGNSSLWRQLRTFVLQRDGYICQYCGVDLTLLPAREIHVDHFVPINLGGGSNLENLKACCSKCNEYKGTACGECPNLRFGKVAS